MYAKPIRNTIKIQPSSSRLPFQSEPSHTMFLFTMLMQISQATEYCTEGGAVEREACLRAKITELERSLTNREPTEWDEEEAQKLLKIAQNAMNNSETVLATKALQDLQNQFPYTRTYKKAKKMLDELEMFGAPLPNIPNLKWIQGKAPDAMGQSDLTIFIFWEVWCPHSRQALPKMNTTFEKYDSRGLQVVGFTKLTRGKTEDDVLSFISESGISFPIAQEYGELSNSFNVSGIPAAAVIQNGTVIWRGHPLRINDAMIEQWLEEYTFPSDSCP